MRVKELKSSKNEYKKTLLERRACQQKAETKLGHKSRLERGNVLRPGHWNKCAMLMM